MSKTYRMVLAVTATLIANAQPPAGPERAAPRGGIEGRLTWLGRQGNAIATVGEPGLYRTLSVAPDGKRVAAERTDKQTQNRDIWVFDASGAGTRLTSDSGWDAFPLWTPDGTRILFTSNRSGVFDLYEKAVNGGGDERLFYHSSEGKGPNGWSPDGRFLVYYSLGQPTHLKVLAAAGPADRTAAPLVEPPFSSVSGRFSPDGRWIAYASNESGRDEVSVRSFNPETGAIGSPVIVTHGGGRAPLWRGDGKEMYYIAGDGMATAIEVKAGAPFQTGVAKPLFPVPAAVLFWDASPDGTRFLMPVAAQ